MCVCLCGFVGTGTMLRTSATVQSYLLHHQLAKCATDKKSSVPTYTLVVHNVALYYMIRWCTRRFWVYIMSYNLDGAHRDVVSLVVCLLVTTLTGEVYVSIHNHDNHVMGNGLLGKGILHEGNIGSGEC